MKCKTYTSELKGLCYGCLFTEKQYAPENIIKGAVSVAWAAAAAAAGGNHEEH